MRRVVRILKVTDTREYEERPNGRYYPIPGSGSFNICARCERSHEVHALVGLDDGTEAVVGTGCAARDAFEMSTRLANAERFAMRLAKLDSQERHFNTRRAQWSEAACTIDGLPIPAAIWLQSETVRGRFEVRVGDGLAFASNPETLLASDRAEREQVARRAWRSNRFAEQGLSDFQPAAPAPFKRKRAQLLLAMAKIVAQGINSLAETAQ